MVSDDKLALDEYLDLIRKKNTCNAEIGILAKIRSFISENAT